MKSKKLLFKSRNRKVVVEFDRVLPQIERVEIKRGKVATRGRKRVFLVDQFPNSRLAVARCLGQTSDLVLCGEAENGGRALEQVGGARPDVVLVELLAQQGYDFIQRLRRRHPRIPILVLSFGDEEQYAPRVLEAGADGYLTKRPGLAALVDGIRAALEGRIVLSQQMRARLLEKCLPAPCCV